MPPARASLSQRRGGAWPACDGVPACELGFGESWTVLRRGLGGEQTKYPALDGTPHRTSIEDVHADAVGNLAADFRTVLRAKPNVLTLPREHVGLRVAVSEQHAAFDCLNLLVRDLPVDEPQHRSRTAALRQCNPNRRFLPGIPRDRMDR